MPDQKTPDSKPIPKAAPKRELTPAGEASDPAVHTLLAELETARTNGADDDARDIIGYLADLGYSAS